MRNKLFIICLITALAAKSLACTSILVSGKASKDGRPLLFKNRDTGTLSNILVDLQGETYRFTGIANAKDTLAHEIWGGYNEKGFSIINTANYNLNKKNMKREREGEVMRAALGKCATLKDFETLLDTMPRPLCVNTNFGVIDAEGGCAYYETGNDGYTKFDANDPVTAPQGFLMRTNFGFTGDRTKDQGSERFSAIKEFMEKACADNNMEAVYLATRIPRYLKHGMTHIDLGNSLPENADDTTMMPFRDYIPRYITSSSILIQGVREKEPASHTIGWTIIGYPLTTVCVPIVLLKGAPLPRTFAPDHKGKSWMAEKGLALKKRLFPYDVSNGHDYINVARLNNKKGTGLLQQTLSVENTIIEKSTPIISKMRKGDPLMEKEWREYYEWIDQYLQAQPLYH